VRRSFQTVSPRTPLNRGEKGGGVIATTLRLRAVFPRIRW